MGEAAPRSRDGPPPWFCYPDTQHTRMTMPSDDYIEPRDAENERDTAQVDEEHTDSDQAEEGVTFASLGLPD